MSSCHITYAKIPGDFRGSARRKASAFLTKANQSHMFLVVNDFHILGSINGPINASEKFTESKVRIAEYSCFTAYLTR